jgi:hypothetical protein
LAQHEGLPLSEAGRKAVTAGAVVFVLALLSSPQQLNDNKMIAAQK